MSWVNLNRVYSIFAGLVLAGMLPAASLSAVESKTISAVDVQQEEGGVTRIVLSGAEDPIYTAFIREDPRRLIIEMPDVVFNGVPTPVRVENGVVNSVMLGAFGDPRVALSMARVSIGLEGEVDYELLPDSDQLVIEIRPKFDLVAKAASPNEPSTAPGDEMAGDESVPAAMLPDSFEALLGAAFMGADKRAEPASEPGHAASPTTTPTLATQADHPEVSRIEKVVANGDTIEILADGPIDNIDSFALDAPERLVIDFWGAQNGISPRQFAVAGNRVERVRIGEYPDKVRVVFDLGVTLESHLVEPTHNGVLVRLVASATSAMAAAGPVPAAADTSDESAVEPDPETAGQGPSASPAVDPTLVFGGSAKVESVHFESLPAVDRVVVSMSQPLDPKLVEPDAATLIVLLPGGSIDPEAERRVETTDFYGPLEMFSVFNTPDIDTPEVRVVMKRRAGAPASLHWREGQLHIELQRSGAAAAGPAVMGAVPAPAMGDGARHAAMRVPAAAPFVGDSMAAVPAAPAPRPSAASAPGFDDDFLGGPADPASIDILEEGGFADDKVYDGRRVSLDFKDADIANILRLIAEVSDLNVIAGEEVVGRVTIRLVDVPWDQALDVILLTKALGFVRVGNVLRIAPLETLKVEAEQRLQARRAKEKLEDLVVKLQPVNFADVKEVAQLVKRLLTGRGSANVDQRTNTLIIKDIPSVVHEATALVKAIDTQTPQVMIEAKIVEATLGFSRSLGAVWGVGYTPGTSGSGGGGEDFHLNPAADAPTNFLASNPVLGAISGLLNLGVLALDDQLQLDLQIQAAESTNKGKVISSPRVVTLDNREAVIKQGVAIKFEEATQDKITISFVDAVLELKVTPHITANRSIIMDIKISRNAPQLSEASGDIVGITKNETQTEALVKDGETIVLGGIYVVESGTGQSRTPFLADIPILGAMFRNRTQQDERRELLVFVTPRIILGSPTDDL